MADFAESLIKRGFANNLEDTSSKLNCLIAVKENLEILGEPPEQFFQEQLENALITVIPTDDNNLEKDE